MMCRLKPHCDGILTSSKLAIQSNLTVAGEQLLKRYGKNLRTTGYQTPNQTHA